MKKHLLYPRQDMCQFWDIEVAGNSFIVTQGAEGTLGQSFTVSFDSEKACIREAAKRVKEKLKLGYIITPEGYIKRFDPPTALREALKDKRIVTTPHGLFTLPALEDVKVISVVVNSPNHDGIYCITGYAIVNDRPASSINAGSSAAALAKAGRVLVWLPMPDLYATWDIADRQLYTFPGTAWHDIEKNLPKYLLRTPENRTPVVSDGGKMWNYFDFIPHSFGAKIEKIQAQSPEARLREAEDFINLYALRLLRHPFCPTLADMYNPLVDLCNLLATTLINEAQHRKAITWLEYSMLIICQSGPMRTREYVDLYLQLALCYFRLSTFDDAIRYMNFYEAFNPAAHKACDDIRASINRVQQLYQQALESRRKAVEQRSSASYEDAIRITRQAILVAPHEPQLYFNLACFYAISFQVKDALYYLEEALKKGYETPLDVLTEQDLENIRDTREFEHITIKYLADKN